MLIDRVLSAQQGNSIEMLALVEQFAGLFRKYGRKLGYEDAENDLQTDFIEFVMRHNFSTLYNTTDGGIVNYIAMFNYRRYLFYLKSVIEEQTISIHDLSVTQQADVERKLSVTDEEDLRLLFPEGILSKKESTILLYVYVYGYSSTDIANTWNVSRQNVNQIRKKAEKKLRSAYC